MAKKSFIKRKRISVSGLTLVATMLALVLLTACATFFATRYYLTRKTEMELQEEIPIENPLIENDYDFENLKWNDYFVSYEDENYYSVQGIDVSSHQHLINWQKVKEAGIEFVFIRVGYRGYETGLIHKDDYFDYNISEAKANGLKVGVYFFSQAISTEEAREEVDFVVDQIKDIEIDFPLVYDLEETGPDGVGRAKVLTQDEKTKIGVTWLHHARNLGYDAMFYGSTNVLPRYFHLENMQEFSCWVAEYGSQPRYPYQFQIWQYTGSGEVDGIETNVDMDILLVPKNDGLWGYE